MYPFVLWTAFGAFIGWLASLVVAASGRRGWTLGHIVLGTVGAVLGGAFFQRNMSSESVSFGSVLTALCGAVILLALANLSLLRRAAQ